MNKGIDTFGIMEFEAALPYDKSTKQPLFKPLGPANGEYVYIVPVTDRVNITIRSSINAYTNVSDGTGQNSIRLWLSAPDNRPLGSKLQAYITRRFGWQERMIETLRELWRMGKKISEPCIMCGSSPIGIYRVKKEGENKGRRFLKCFNCKAFTWLEEKS